METKTCNGKHRWPKSFESRSTSHRGCRFIWQCIECLATKVVIDVANWNGTGVDVVSAEYVCEPPTFRRNVGEEL